MTRTDTNIISTDMILDQRRQQEPFQGSLRLSTDCPIQRIREWADPSLGLRLPAKVAAQGDYAERMMMLALPDPDEWVRELVVSYDTPHGHDEWRSQHRGRIDMIHHLHGIVEVKSCSGMPPQSLVETNMRQVHRYQWACRMMYGDQYPLDAALVYINVAGSAPIIQHTIRIPADEQRLQRTHMEFSRITAFLADMHDQQMIMDADADDYAAYDLSCRCGSCWTKTTPAPSNDIALADLVTTYYMLKQDADAAKREMDAIRDEISTITSTDQPTTAPVVAGGSTPLECRLAWTKPSQRERVDASAAHQAGIITDQQWELMKAGGYITTTETKPSLRLTFRKSKD